MQITPPEDVEELKFGNVRIWLPKKDMKEVWKKIKRIVDIYLEEESDGSL